MSLPNDILLLLKELDTRISALEGTNQNKNIKIPTGGKFVVDSETADPPIENGRIYYNTSTNKLRKCVNGTWSDVG